ncbi:uncharacterized protein [Physcomitrium patens]|uniref:uncharacterized protein isoform X2 n=1 Tax=Physcomitrium patens TaxID=3218 RepID=UPI003CCD8E27
MAPCRNSVRRLCVCGVFVFFLLLADSAAAQELQRQRASGEVGPSQNFYLRGTAASLAEPQASIDELSFEEFERRELTDQYSDPGANCENDPSLCP